MTEIVGVRFKKVGKVYFFDPCGIALKRGQDAIVETARGLEMGQCALENCEVDDESVVQPLRKLVRVATDEDRETAKQNGEKERRALEICQQKIAEHGLEMKFVDVEYTFDASKIMFYFTAEGRVDFRDLVKDLASVFRTRIELRQIGVRDEAKMLGGLGICGKPFCCSTFLDEFQPVSIKMAKEQSLSLNPTKISGTCGRLMCCLKYEQNAYEHLLKITPRVDSLVMTPDGEGVVIDVSLLRGILKVRLTKNSDAAPEAYALKDIEVLRSATGKRRKPGAVDRTPPATARAAEPPALKENATAALPEVFTVREPEIIRQNGGAAGGERQRGDRRPNGGSGGERRQREERSGPQGQRGPADRSANGGQNGQGERKQNQERRQFRPSGGENGAPQGQNGPGGERTHRQPAKEGAKISADRPPRTQPPGQQRDRGNGPRRGAPRPPKKDAESQPAGQNEKLDGQRPKRNRNRRSHGGQEGRPGQDSGGPAK